MVGFKPGPLGQNAVIVLLAPPTRPLEDTKKVLVSLVSNRGLGQLSILLSS